MQLFILFVIIIHFEFLLSLFASVRTMKQNYKIVIMLFTSNQLKRRENKNIFRHVRFSDYNLFAHVSSFIVLPENALQQNKSDRKRWESYDFPSWCGSVGWTSSCKAKSHQFDSQSGHMPGFRVQSQSRGVWERQLIGSWLMFLSFCPSLPLSKNK